MGQGLVQDLKAEYESQPSFHLAENAGRQQGGPPHFTAAHYQSSRGKANACQCASTGSRAEFSSP
jgi:hypothetical protein